VQNENPLFYQHLRVRAQNNLQNPMFIATISRSWFYSAAVPVTADHPGWRAL
jgi:hypothetical protein